MAPPRKELLLVHGDELKPSASPRNSATAEIRKRLVDYVNTNLVGDENWTKGSEIPTKEEVGGIEDEGVRKASFHVPMAKIEGQYESKEEYLATQYKLMRTDGIMPLAKCVDDFRRGNLRPESNDYRVYDEVFMTSLLVARDGLAFQVEFSASTLGKVIYWAKSKRLRTGSLVALSLASDNFKTICVPAIVASRLLENLEVKAPRKPSIHIYVGDAQQIEVDPQQKWVMIECTQGYWEAYRHTLRALQKVRLESFPMDEYLVNVQQAVDGPKYLLKDSIKDISHAAHGDAPQLENLDILGEWPAFQEIGEPQKDPSKIPSAMDSSQLQALKRILTKKLAIIQGPPGTGKTYTSVSAIKILLHNAKAGDPPIIIAAQTNHAVDQILRHISKFEPEFIRLGGQTTDHDIIKPRTLYQLKYGKTKQPPSRTTKFSMDMRKSIGAEIEQILVPLQLGEPMSAEMFFENGLLSEKQMNSINNSQSMWISDSAQNKMNIWCNNRLVEVTNEDSINEYAAKLAEEHENLDEKELEAPENEDDKFEVLVGRRFLLHAGFQAKGRSSGISDQEVQSLLNNKQDLQDIPMVNRPAVYDYLRRELTSKITERLRVLGSKCQEAAKLAKIGKWESDYEYVSTAKVIGLTTTGLSKYRGLLSVLNPKIVLIEEAAETLEPYTAAAVFDTLEHLILVGDHQQLRANCCLPELIGEPVNFDISLFERLVINNLEYSKLKTQRRMRPEIRQLINHIYPDLTDHSSVLDRPSIGGLGGSNVWFWHHENPESMDEAKSKQNLTEAKMVVAFTKYLLWNRVPIGKITILTFYNGQKKLILSYFKQDELYRGLRLNVCTVDSYQGEENDVVLLSLVRNNDYDNIGFLSSINRACVALSRARVGFYIFGNARLLLSSDHWHKVIGEFQDQEALRKYLPLYCPVHSEEVEATSYPDIDGLHGGCDRPCGKVLACGHNCPLKCHPGRECQAEDCYESCPKILNCGHPCSYDCRDACECQICADELKKSRAYYHFGTNEAQGKGKGKAQEKISSKNGAENRVSSVGNGMEDMPGSAKSSLPGYNADVSSMVETELATDIQSRIFPTGHVSDAAHTRIKKWSEFARAETSRHMDSKQKAAAVALGGGTQSIGAHNKTSNRNAQLISISESSESHVDGQADIKANPVMPPPIERLIDITDEVSLQDQPDNGRQLRTSKFNYRQQSLI